MAEVLIILDGATDAPATPLDLRDMPALRRLAQEGETRWLDLLDPGVPVGSETAIASLLGWRPGGPVDRGLVEAAARGLAPEPGEHVWRLDIAEHRVLAFATAEPQVSGSAPLRVWPAGLRPPHLFDGTTVIVGAAGAATGLGALMGARTVIPPGATGCRRSDLAGKCEAAIAALAGGAERVVVHVGGADEAAHARDPQAKAAVLRAADRDLIAPLAQAARERGARLQVGPDHGCDPVTGAHVGGPVPHVFWSAA